MTTIRATCPRCLEITIGAHRVSVMLEAQSRQMTFAFRCPKCARVRVQNVPDAMRGELTEVVPAFVFTKCWPDTVSDKPRFSGADLLGFSMQLEVAEDLAGLAARESA